MKPRNPLQNVIPARYRKWVYAAVFVAGLVFAAWQGADGDWEQFTAALITSVTSALAHGNTPRDEPPQ